MLIRMSACLYGFLVTRPPVFSRFAIDVSRTCMDRALRHAAGRGTEVSRGFVVHVSERWGQSELA